MGYLRERNFEIAEGKSRNLGFPGEMAKGEKMVINWKKLYGKHADSARQLWKCIQWDGKIFKKYAEAFEALAEYDRTGKLPKLNYKKE